MLFFLNKINPEEKTQCAGEDTYATECGSDYLEASPSCCPGLVCNTGTMMCVQSL